MSHQAPYQATVDFFDTHPINEDQILQKVKDSGVSLDKLTEDILKQYDQDHYGGLEAVDILANKTGAQANSYILDVCSGMGGPARYLAHKYGCRVMGLDITESRYQGALHLTKLVKLDHLVDFRLGNAINMPFANDTFDIVISQESWAHIPQKAQVISECARVLKPQGILAFTDLTKTTSLGTIEEKRLQCEMAAHNMETLDGYSHLLRQAGFAILEREDLSAYWTEILVQRLNMYRSLKETTVEKFGEEHYRKWDDTYSFFVGLYADNQLGGGRFVARLDKQA